MTSEVKNPPLDPPETWFTADQHFGHTNIIKFQNRPYDNAHHMQEVFINNWNAVVGQGDKVYILGDFSFNSPGYTTAILSRLHGHKCLVEGNHDKGSSKWRGIMRLPPIQRLTFGKIQMVLCHYPMLSWQGSNRGSWMLHGHSHGRIPNSGFRYDVGVDCNAYAPVSLTTLKSYFAKIEVAKKKSEQSKQEDAEG